MASVLLAWAGLPVWSHAADAPTTAPSDDTATTIPGGEQTETKQIISKGLDESGGVRLTVKQSRRLVTSVPVRTIDLAQPEIVNARPVMPTQIRLVGLKPGIAELVLWDDQGHSQTVQITVEADLSGLRNELKKLLPNNQIELSEANGSVILRGRVPSAQIADQAVQIATPFGAKVVNLLEIAGGQQVTLQVRFAEVSRDATVNLGFNAFASGGPTRFGWNNGPGDSPTGGLVGGAASTSIDPSVSLFGTGKSGIFAFEFFLQAMRENNLLRVLAEPNLTVISGKQASFLAGGEFPYPVPQSGGAGGAGTAITIQYKQFGVRLNFTPVVLGDGRIRLEVAPEVSDLDFTHSLQLNGFVIPALTTRNASTVVELSDGQTLAMAGLLNNRVNANSSVTPLLGDLPIVGTLFRSVRYTRNETELVVLVTPRLSSGMNPAQVPALPGEVWRFPTEAQMFWKHDLGGPVADTAHAPTQAAPPRFHGTYGFAPAPATTQEK